MPAEHNKNLNRRSFIKKASSAAMGAIGFPYVITTNAMGNRKVSAASNRVTVGHIGVGGQGTGLLRNFLSVDDCQSVAVCDAFTDRRNNRAKLIDDFYADKYGKAGYRGCTAYKDFRELLARDDIDAVVIATPDHWHVPIAIEAARAGKDMYVEKPLGLSLHWNKKLRETIHSFGNIFQYGTQQRSSRNFRFACELARNQYIGELKNIDVWCEGSSIGGSTEPIPVPKGFDYNLWLGPAPVSPYTADRCTNLGTYFVADNCLGFIAGWGAHPLDIAQWGNNSDNTSPIEYSGSGKFPTQGLYNTAYTWDINCKYADGVTMHFMSTDVAEPVISKYRRHNRQGTTFTGSEGWVSVDRRGIYAKPESLLNIKLKRNDIHLYESLHHQHRSRGSFRCDKSFERYCHQNRKYCSVGSGKRNNN